MTTVYSFIKYHLVLILIVFIIAWPASAQESATPDNPEHELDFRTQNKLHTDPPPIRPYRFKLQNYQPMDLKSLFNLYWKAGIAKTDNKDNLIEYLRTVECKVYESTYENDFVWPQVLKSTSNYINKNKKDFPTQFTIVQPIALGRYDPDKKWMMITTDTQYLNVKALTFAHYDGYTSCAGNQTLQTIPLRAEIDLKQPFSLTYIPMNSDFAKRYIDYVRMVGNKTSVMNQQRDRYAYVKFYFSITGLNTDKTTETNAVFTGVLDGYYVSVDTEGTMPLIEWVNSNGTTNQFVEKKTEEAPKIHSVY